AATGRVVALGRARLEGVGRAVVGGPVAALGDVAGARRRPADRRALRIRGAVGAAPRAELGRIADTGGGPALDRARLEGVGRATGAQAGAALGDIAGTPRGAALGRARLEGVRRAGGAGPGTELGDVAGAGGRATLRGARLHHVGRAVVGGAVAALGSVAVAGRGPADGRALRIGGAGGGAP